ncbi:MAG: hypothetical protein IPG86_19795 [Chitinophagaceae bacterium]|nr:hypothetical protein [Chitinophagaceae bacterium]
MSTPEIVARVKEAIDTWVTKDKGNLERNLHEVNASGRLTSFLIPLFSEYDVDPEYNGDMGKPNDRKALEIAKNRIREVRKKVHNDDNYECRPDIIIHKRQTNDHNLVVIEVKKDIHQQDDKDYDLIKLEHLTIDHLGNHYNYKLGVSVIIGTGQNAGKWEINYFQEGDPRQEDKLK